MQTHRLEIPERLGGGWVDIRAKRSWGASARIETSGIAVDHTGQQATVNGLDRGLAILETAVIAWSLPIPANREGFLSDDFDPDVGDWLVDAIEEHYQAQRRTDDESKTEGAPSTAS